MLNELEELAFLARILAGLVHDRLGHFSVRDLNVVLLTQLGQQQAKAHTTLGQTVMFVGRFDLGVIVTFDLGVFLVPQLMRDLLGLSLDQRGRQIEFHGFIQLVQQLALHDRAGGTGIFGLQAFLDLTFQGCQILCAVFRGQFIVDFGGDGLFHFLDGAVEDRGLTGQVLGTVFFGEGHLDGFFITGDLGKIDEDGYVHIVGRNKDLIISGGYNIYPKEIELLLDDQPGVLESAVIGVAHPDFGETVLGVIVPTPGETPDIEAIMLAVRTQLARFKHPRKLILIDELPRNTMGKVQKNILRDSYKDMFTG